METNPVVGARIRRVVRNGAGLLAATFGRTQVTDIARSWVQIAPGGVPVLAAWMMGRVLESAGGNGEFSALRRAVGSVDARRLERECGVGPERVEELLADLRGATHPVVVYLSTGREEDTALVGELAALLAHRRGEGGLLFVRPEANLDGLRIADLLPDGESAARVRRMARTGDFAAAWLVREDPLGDGSLKNLPADLFLVVQDSAMTDTAACADVVLPASVSLETGGLFVAPDLRLVFARPCVAPVLERSTIDILQDALRIAGKSPADFALPHALAQLLKERPHQLDKPAVVDWPAPPIS